MQADTHSASCRNVWSIWQELHCHSETSSYGRYNALKPFLPCGGDRGKVGGQAASTTSAHGPSPSALISTSLKTQATHPPSVRERARKYPTAVAPPISRRSHETAALAQPRKSRSDAGRQPRRTALRHWAMPRRAGSSTRRPAGRRSRVVDVFGIVTGHRTFAERRASSPARYRRSRSGPGGRLRSRRRSPEARSGGRFKHDMSGVMKRLRRRRGPRRSASRIAGSGAFLRTAGL